MAKITGIKQGYRSGLEDLVGKQLGHASVPYKYEDKESKIEYTKPEKKHKYNPDFTFPDCHIIVETKGRFVTADRQKQLLVKAQHPHLDVRFVFSNSRAKISKISKTTYADWCKKHNFKYADKYIPQEWIDEIKSITSKGK